MQSVSRLKIQMMPSISNVFTNVHIFDQTHLLKIVDMKHFQTVCENSKKKIEKVILPDEEGIYKILFDEKHFCYTQERVLGFQYLDSFRMYEQHFSDQEILKFYRDLLGRIAIMHEKNVVSGDIHSSNILLNANLDYRFIDFDLNGFPLFLENYDSNFLNQEMDFSSQVKLSDKMCMLSLILYSLLQRDFLKKRFAYEKTFQILESLELPNSINQKFIDLLTCKELPAVDDYFLEEFDTLIQSDYKPPYRKR